MAATAEAAVNWLGNLAVEEAKFLYAVNQKVEDLQDELKWMTCFLQDVDAKRDRDARLREWIKQIVWMAYEVEDVIESFVLKVEANRRSGLMNKLKRYACFIRELILIHKVGSDIDALTLKISKLTSRLQTYGIKLTTEYDTSSVRRDVLLRRSYEHYVQDEKDIVGMEKDVNEVVNKLKADDIKTIALCGMGGLGKTTLAKKVYHKEEVKKHFQAVAWASISQQCQVKDVLEKLYNDLTPGNAHRNIEETDPVKKLYKVQQQNKCLVVLDDIWKNDDWDFLKKAFPVGLENSHGGKLMVTTRIQSVANYIDDKAYIHKQLVLNKDDALQLLKRKLGRDGSDIFKGHQGSEKEKLAKEMLQHCGGLPLAIVALGGILATKKSLDEWTATAANIKSLLSNVRAGDGLSCKEVLELSYYDLPVYLKPCFLYLGILPEDAEIPVRKLIHLWVAEGFISTSFDEDYMEPQGTLEEVAETYLAELVDRSLIQVVSITKSGRMRRCRIHDLVRDLCLSEAAKEDFLKLVVANGSQPHSTSSSLIAINTRRRYRRLAIHGERGVDWPNILTDFASNNKFNPQHIKSLFIRDDYDPYGNESCQDSLTRKVLKPFKSLRVLDLDRVRATALPKEVGDLVQLRYLSIRGSHISILPSSIENLRSLRTLDLRVSNANLKLPFVIWIRMRQLRHLYMPEYRYLTPEDSWKEMCRYTFDRLHMLAWEDSLKNTTLETIKEVYPRHTKYLTQCSNLRKLWFKETLCMEKEELEHMTNPQSLLCGCLKRLRLIVEWDAATGLAAAFANFVHLNEMRLKISHKLPFDGSTSLKSGMLHDSITTLWIEDTRIENTDAMQILGSLPNLRELILARDSYIGKHMTCSQQGFPKLTLCLLMLNELEGWTIEEGAMTSLRELAIADCRQLEMIPDGIKFIPSLKVLNLIDMPESFTDRVSKRSEATGEGHGEDDDKLAKQSRLRGINQRASQLRVSQATESSTSKNSDNPATQSRFKTDNKHPTQ